MLIIINVPLCTSVLLKGRHEYKLLHRMASSVCLDVNEGHSILWTSLRRCSCEDEALFCVIREQG